jgi:hypothetical protein
MRRSTGMRRAVRRARALCRRALVSKLRQMRSWVHAQVRRALKCAVRHGAAHWSPCAGKP